MYGGCAHPHELHDQHGRVGLQARAVELYDVAVVADALQQPDLLQRQQATVSGRAPASAGMPTASWQAHSNARNKLPTLAVIKSMPSTVRQA